MASGMDASTLAAMVAALTPEQIAQAEYDIQNTGRITMSSFKAALGALFGLACFCLFGRIIIRLFSRRRLFLDDGILIFAWVCLVGATAIMYTRVQWIYLEFSVLRGDEIAALLAYKDIGELYQQSKWQLSYLLFLWTVVFAVKWTYFAFFHPLLRAMARSIIYYYYFAIAFSVMSWLFLIVGEQLITCPHVGNDAGKCFPNLPVSHNALIALFWICPVLDGLTDLMIITIPILILRQSQMRLLTKIGLGLFLCLSGFMLACSIIRAAGTTWHGFLDYPWQVFFLHAEACIGVIMGSITVYRSTLVGSNEVSDKLQSYLARIFKRSSRTHFPDDSDEKRTAQSGAGKAGFRLPRIPGATLTGLRTKLGVRTTQRSVGSSENGLHSQDSDLDFVTDYHAHLKRASDSGSLSRTSGPSHAEEVSSNRCSYDYAVTSQPRPQHRIGGFQGFLLRLALPHAHRVSLQHRSIGDGGTEHHTKE